MANYNLIIGGMQIETDSYFDVVNPATETVVGRCPAASAEQLDQAVSAAREAYAGWSQTSSLERKKALLDIADKLESDFENLARLVTQEQGKPLNAYAGMGSRFEVGGAIAWCRATAEMELSVKVLQDTEEARIALYRKPLGVVASITPWNWPLLIAIWHVMPALRTGNTVVIKPSSLTPLSTLRFVELANEVLPAGVLNVVTGEGGLGRSITSHPGIDKIVFTGSTPTGKTIMQSAATNLKRLTLELGGNDAGIVLPDVDPKQVAPKLFAAAFSNSGQTCAALKRLYVHDDIYDAICDALVAIAKSVNVGNGLEEGIDYGPVQNADQLREVLELAESARADGGRFLTGGEVNPAQKGYFYPITLVADIKDGSRLVDEEPFGPILPIIRYSDIDEVIERANNNPNGLGGSVWSADIEKATELVKRLECGSGWVNSHGNVQPNVPFGGVKQSGVGVEFGIEGLEEYTTIQAVNISKR